MASKKKPKGKTEIPGFQDWYAVQAKTYGLNKNPDSPAQQYDYRAAFKAQAYPTGPKGQEHWPSEFKKIGHPHLIVDGINTKTGYPIRSTKDKGRKIGGRR